jgi:hypothetical protein
MAVSVKPVPFRLSLLSYSVAWCDSTNHVLQVTDWLAHVPKEVIAKNFQLNITAFDHIPSRELYIFPSSAYLIE